LAKYPKGPNQVEAHLVQVIQVQVEAHIVQKKKEICKKKYSLIFLQK